MKPIIAFILFGICAYIGYSKPSVIKRRLRTVDSMARNIKQLGMMMDYKLMPIRELIGGLGDGVFWRELLKNIKANDPLAETFLSTLEQLTKSNPQFTCLEQSDIWILSDFGATLGISDLKTQKNNIALTLERMDERIQSLKIELKEKEKTYRALGILSGIAAAMIIW
ncbi:MAG: stage III sporulation protein AB [Clostridia bacterium]